MVISITEVRQNRTDGTTAISWAVSSTVSSTITSSVSSTRRRALHTRLALHTLAGLALHTLAAQALHRQAASELGPAPHRQQVQVRELRSHTRLVLHPPPQVHPLDKDLPLLLGEAFCKRGHLVLIRRLRRLLHREHRQSQHLQVHCLYDRRLPHRRLRRAVRLPTIPNFVPGP